MDSARKHKLEMKGQYSIYAKLRQLLFQSIYLFKYSFTQQLKVCTECPLYMRYFLGTRNTSVNKVVRNACLHGTSIEKTM